MTQDEEDSEMLTPVLPTTPLDGWTLDNLPDNLPKHTELIRGALVVSPQRAWHLFAIRMIEYALVRQAPEEFLVFREMAIRKSNRSAPEPDLSIVDASAVDLDTRSTSRSPPRPASTTNRVRGSRTLEVCEF
jgi:hypothetical protein